MDGSDFTASCKEERFWKVGSLLRIDQQCDVVCGQGYGGGGLIGWTHRESMRNIRKKVSSIMRQWCWRCGWKDGRQQTESLPGFCHQNTYRPQCDRRHLPCPGGDIGSPPLPPSLSSLALHISRPWPSRLCPLRTTSSFAKDVSFSRR